MSLNYLLDTNICIYITKNKPMSVLERFEQLSVGEVGMSTVTYGELLYGAEKSQHPQKTKSIVDQIVSMIPVMPIPINAGQYYGSIRHQLSQQGKLIGNNDLWIAAHAMSLDVILVTNNLKEFKRVVNCKIENWVS